MDKKICLAASSGGHLEQLTMLFPLLKKYEGFVVTEKTPYAEEFSYPTYFVEQLNRKEISIVKKLVLNVKQSYKIIKEEKPDVIIATGVLGTIPLCLLGKWKGAKLIYIESFAKVNTPTLSGKFLYKYADRFYVQWKPLLKVYPKAIYLGGGIY